MRFLVDAEDVAQEAFSSFFRCLEEGRFPQLHDRSDLWQILIVLASRRAADYQRRALAERRGGGNVCGDSEMHLLAVTNYATSDPFDSLEALPITPECDLANAVGSPMTKNNSTKSGGKSVSYGTK